MTASRFRPRTWIPNTRRSRRSLAVLLRDLPPTPKGRHHELRGLGLREFAGLRADTDPLDPFVLARYAKLLVVSFDDVRSLLSEESRSHLVGAGKDSWSGGAASHKLPDGRRLIILNPTHGRNRQHATLMEEICHVFLGHLPSRLAIERRDRRGNVIARDYNHSIEEEAYSTGAAALVPYTALKRMISEGKTFAEIGRHYRVSRSLVEFRVKISRLWDLYQKKVFSG